MFKVGLTGNYFSGLDEVSNSFKKLKIPITTFMIASDP